MNNVKSTLNFLIEGAIMEKNQKLIIGGKPGNGCAKSDTFLMQFYYK